MHRNAVTVPITVDPTDVREPFPRSSTGNARDMGPNSNSAKKLSKPSKMKRGTVKPNITFNE